MASPVEGWERHWNQIRFHAHLPWPIDGQYGEGRGFVITMWVAAWEGRQFSLMSQWRYCTSRALGADENKKLSSLSVAKVQQVRSLINGHSNEIYTL